jgi:hypothetical protein
MAGRFNNPYPQFLDSTPNVYSGGTLTFYASGTSTLQSVYSDDALLVALTNPVTLNSAGRPNTDIFLQDLDYKVVLKDSDGNTIWTADPVSARDSDLIAKTLTGSGSPNGTTAGTAGSTTILPDFYWDFTNEILYICTTTGTSSTAVWTAINGSGQTPSVPPPQGRLTLVSGSPVHTTDQTAKTAVYYTPFTGNLVPIYNGTSMVPTEFAELTLTLSASGHSASSIYDVFAFSNSGVVTLVTGPAWTTATAGSGARGSGASTTELTRVKGIWVNAVSMTARNGSTTYTVGANLATFLGSIFIDASAGQVSCHMSYGQSRKWGISNAYNRVPVYLKAGDATASWVYSTNTTRAARGDSGNSITVFSCLAEEMYDLTRHNLVSSAVANTGTINAQVGIGYNSTSAFSGTSGVTQIINSTGGSMTYEATLTGRYIAPPSLGINTVTALENGLGGSGMTFNGQEGSMYVAASWRA